MNPYAIQLQNYKGGTWAFTEYEGVKRKLTRGETRRLLKRLRQGDRSVITTLIEANIPLALKLAGNAVHLDNAVRREKGDKRKYTTAEDVLAAALLGLVKAANRLKPKRGYCSIASYAADFIAGEIYNELTARPEGKEQSDPPDVPFSDLEHVHGSDFDERLKFFAPLDMRELLELRDLMERCCKEPGDMELIDLRLAGHSFESIEREMGVPQSTARDRYWRLAKRVAKRLGLPIPRGWECMPEAA